MTLNELTNMIWYVQEIIVLDYSPNSIDISELKEKAVFYGDNAELRSDLYKDIKGKYVQSFGALDDFVVVVLK